MKLAAITIDMSPTLEIGPARIAWHGLMIAIGILLGSCMALRDADTRGLSRDELWATIGAAVLTGIVGARLLYLVEHGQLSPGALIGTRGFSIYGGVAGGALGALAYIRRRRLVTGYLDALAFGYPLGLAVGRIGDLVSGEHHGMPTAVAWGVRYLNPNAEVPRTGVAYQSGALYEIALGLAMLVLVVALRRRLERPLEVLWVVLASYGAGRFAMFFFRTDSGSAWLGLSVSHWLSLGLLAVGLAGLSWTRRRWPAGRRVILIQR